MSAINPHHLRRTLAREHEAALSSERAARPFRQYRLNIPGEPVDTQPLVTAAEWARVCARPVPACEGRPTIGVDLGGIEIVVCRVCRLAVWSNRGMGFSAWCSSVWPRQSARTKYPRARMRSWSGRADWQWTRRAPSQTSGCCCRVSGSGSRRSLVSDPYRSARAASGRGVAACGSSRRARGGGESTIERPGAQVAAPRLQLRRD